MLYLDLFKRRETNTKPDALRYVVINQGSIPGHGGLRDPKSYVKKVLGME